MKHTLRALLALALLVGFYVFALAVVGGMVGLVVAIARAGVDGFVLAKVGILVAVVAFVVTRALFSRRKAHQSAPGGYLLTEDAEPALWTEVRRIASFAGTRAPDEIRLIPEVNAAVSEESRWLGLIGGTRRLYLGVPLLLGLTKDQFRSVLAHELGHYSGRHTALGAITYRGQESISRVISDLGPDSLTGQAFKLYARLYFAVSHTVNRHQELEADQLSAVLVGSETSSSALRELGPLDAAWNFYLETYADLGSQVGHRPTDLYEGFAAFLASPVRQGQLDEARRDQEEPTRSVYDSHPPVSERVAALTALAHPSEPDSSGPANSLVSATSMATAQEALWEGSTSTAAPLAAIVPLAAAQAVHYNARVVRAQLASTGVTPDLAGAVALFRAGRSAELLRPLAPELDDETLRSDAGHLVGDLAVEQLLAAGRATHWLNWDGGWLLTDAEGELVEPWPVAAAAAHDPAGTEAFASWLEAYDLDLSATGPSDAAHPDMTTSAPEILALAAPVGGNRTLVVLNRGVVMHRASLADKVAMSPSTLIGRAPAALIRRALRGGVDGLLASPRATLFRWDEITSASYRAKALGRGLLTLTAGAEVTQAKFVVETVRDGDPIEVIAHFLGDRFTRI